MALLRKELRMCKMNYYEFMRGSGENVSASTRSRNSSSTEPSPDSVRLMGQAEELCERLVAAGAEAVAVFGSVARGSASPSSDLDILVIWEQEQGLKRTVGLEHFDDIGVSTARWKKLENPDNKQWSFYQSLSPDAVYLHDPAQRLQKTLTGLSKSPGKYCLEATSSRLRDCLRDYKELARFGSIYTFLYQDCYRWSKVGVTEANICRGQLLATREDNFDGFLERHPELKEDILWIESIQSFYLRVRTGEMLRSPTETLTRRRNGASPRQRRSSTRLAMNSMLSLCKDSNPYLSEII